MRWDVGARRAEQEARAERLAVLVMKIELLERQIEGAGMWLPFSVRRYQAQLDLLMAEVEVLRAEIAAAEAEEAHQLAAIAEEERQEAERRKTEKRRREAQQQEEQRREEERREEERRAAEEARREERRRAAEQEQRLEARRREERRQALQQPAKLVLPAVSLRTEADTQVPSPSARPAAQGTAPRKPAVGEEVRAVAAEPVRAVTRAPTEPTAPVRTPAAPLTTRQAAPALPVKVAVPVQAASDSAHPAMTGGDLVAWRKGRGLTQQAVAALLNTTQGNLSKIESRRSVSLPPDWIARLVAHG